MRTSITPLRVCVAAVFFSVLLAVNAYSQGVTTAAMNGRITGKNNEAIPGVNIVAVHVPSGTTYGTSSRVDGRYTIPNLRVGGPYTVSASIVGYKKSTREGIYLQLSQTLDLNFSLIEEAVQADEVLITAERSAVFNASRTGAATNVARDQIDRLPTISRNFQDYYKVSPYFSSTTASGSPGGNALGRNSKYSSIQIDGTNFNDVFGLGGTGAPAGQSTVTPISLDAIEEFQIVVSPYDVRQSGFTGAGINAVTRSGTNDYKASAFYFGRNEGFAGKSPDTLKTKLAGFKDYQIGGRIGGPIIENELFFFANAEVTRFSQPFSRIFGQSAIGTNAYTAKAESLQMVTDKLMSQYGYDPGSFTNIGYNRESDKFFLRFDYNVLEGHKLSARWNYLRSSEDNSPSRGRNPTDIYYDNGKYKLDNKTHSVSVQLTSVFGNTASNELTVGYVDQFDNPLYYGKPFPTLYIGTSGTNAALKQNLVLGAEQFRHYNELGQKYFEITNNFSWYMPDHTITVGAKADLFKFRNLFISDAFGAYTYNWVVDFLQNKTPTGYSFRYSATSDPLQQSRWGANQLGAYAQDEWTVSPAVKLVLGLRVDVPMYPDVPNYNANIESIFGYRTDRLPSAAFTFSPRVGFNWSVDEERNTQVHGGVGLFSGKFPFVWVGNQYANTGVDFYTVTSLTVNGQPRTFNPDPYGQFKPPTSTLPSAEVDLTDPNFRAPSIIRWNLAVDHKLPFDLTATLEGIFSITQNDVYYQNINLRGQQNNGTGATAFTPGGVLRGENRPVYGTYSTTTSRFSPVWVNSALFAPGVFLVRNTDKGFNSNITAQVSRNSLDGLNGTVAYTWGRAKDINSGNSTTASSGWRFNPTQGNPNDPTLTFSQWDRTHRILATVSYRQDWGSGFATTIGAFYNAQSGRPFSYMTSGDVNGDGRTDNDLAYIPKDANDIILMSGSTKLTDKTRAEYTQLMAFIDADPYLSKHKGQVSERSGAREPWAHQVDLRLAQEIPTIAGQKIELTLDILNVLNLINGEWGWVRNTGINQVTNLLTFHSLDNTANSPDYGRPRYSVPPLKVTDGKADPFTADNILSRWQMQFGVRYTL